VIQLHDPVGWSFWGLLGHIPLLDLLLELSELVGSEDDAAGMPFG
jgi:hypothetical protein